MNQEYIEQEARFLGRKAGKIARKKECSKDDWKDHYIHTSKLLPMLRELVGYEYTKHCAPTSSEGYHSDSFRTGDDQHEQQLNRIALPAYWDGFSAIQF